MVKRALVAAALGVLGAGGIMIGAGRMHGVNHPSRQETAMDSRSALAQGAAKRVFGSASSARVTATRSSEDFGANVVTVDTSKGSLDLLDTDGQVTFISFRDVDLTSQALTVSVDEAAASAQQVVNRIYPWASHFPVTGGREPHGSYFSYAFKWRSVVNGVTLPSWVNATVTSSGVVQNLAANYFPIAAVPQSHMSQDQALAIALRTLGGKTTLQKAMLQMGMAQGSMRLMWYMELSTDPSPNAAGLYELPGRLILIDAVTGVVLHAQ